MSIKILATPHVTTAPQSNYGGPPTYLGGDLVWFSDGVQSCLAGVGGGVLLRDLQHVLQGGHTSPSRHTTHGVSAPPARQGRPHTTHSAQCWALETPRSTHSVPCPPGARSAVKTPMNGQDQHQPGLRPLLSPPSLPTGQEAGTQSCWSLTETIPRLEPEGPSF